MPWNSWLSIWCYQKYEGLLALLRCPINILCYVLFPKLYIAEKDVANGGLEFKLYGSYSFDLKRIPQKKHCPYFNIYLWKADIFHRLPEKG
jgi:hypothetical protein